MVRDGDLGIHGHWTGRGRIDWTTAGRPDCDEAFRRHDGVATKTDTVSVHDRSIIGGKQETDLSGARGHELHVTGIHPGWGPVRGRQDARGIE